MMISIDDFQTISIDDKPLFNKIYKKYPPTHSDYVFSTMVSWMDYMEYRYAYVDGNIAIMTLYNDKIQFRPPIGERNIDLVKQVMKLASREDSEVLLGVIDSSAKEWLSLEFPDMEFIPHRDFFDYVYLSSDLVDLPGKPYIKIRNRLNKFKREYTYDHEEITEDNFDEVRKFLKRWCLWKDCASIPMLEFEKKAIMYSISNFFDLDLGGCIIRIDGNIEAISICEAMSQNTAIIHYEKGIADFNGIYQAINWETAYGLSKSYRFINREPDMGVKGLRQAKMGYRPHHMIEVFHVNK